MIVWRIDRQNIDTLLIAGYGGFLSLFFGGMLASHYLQGDLLLLRPGVPLAHKLSDIALLVHLGVALSLMLAPLHLRFWGLLAAVLTAVAAAFTVYFYGQQPNPAVDSLLYGLGMWLLLEVVPAFYLIHMAFSRLNEFSSFDQETC